MVIDNGICVQWEQRKLTIEWLFSITLSSSVYKKILIFELHQAFEFLNFFVAF